MSESFGRVALLGSGATALYFLNHLLARAEALRGRVASVTVFERGGRAGMGMPYHPDTTDRHNLCNISSEELPRLDATLVEWLDTLGDDHLARFDIERDGIDSAETYPRVALGEYFEAQFHTVVERLNGAGIAVEVRLHTPVADLIDDPRKGVVTVVTEAGREAFDTVVIATGHAFQEGDDAANGYYASPWPMHKLLPAEGRFHNFAIGTLGASLSAFDVVTSLAHRHGRFVEAGGRLRFEPDAGAPDFRLALHAAHGWLPHLQYEQDEPFRAVYRHVTREGLLGLRDGDGRLRLGAYFDGVCRPALAEAFRGDGRGDVAERLEDAGYTLDDFVEQMEGEHSYDDPFAGMKSEMPEARRSLEKDRPIHWKEVLDDLMYTLNYHAELMPAEDHAKLRSVVMPFLLNVIAAMPLGSAKTLLALHDAGRLDLVEGYATVEERADGRTTLSVDNDGEETRVDYRMFVDCTGQPPVDVDSYPFRGLVEGGSVRAARAAFADAAAAGELFEEHPERRLGVDGEALCRLDGIDVDAAYRVIGEDGTPNPRVHDIAFTHTLGLRPYSYGLQACDHTAGLVVASWAAEAEGGDGAVHPEEAAGAGVGTG